MIELINSETVTVPGLYRQHEVSYHGDPCPLPSLSRSIALKLVEESPRHAFTAHPRLNPQEPEEEKNDATREIGSAAHALLLRQPTEICVIDAKDYRTKKAQEERTEAQARGAIPLLTKDYATAVAMVEKARADLAFSDHAAIRALAEPDDSVIYNEVTAAWIDRCGDHWARIRLDRLSVSRDRITVIDYKTTKLSVEPMAAARAIYNNIYHFQDGFYRRGIRALFPAIDRHELKLDFLFILQEQEPPHEITVARVDPAGRLIGEKMVSTAFLLWRKCMAENHWPGYPNEIVTAEMPAYVDTRWTSREIEDPRLQGLGFDPMPFFETNPYQPKQITEPC
ncbi:PD-(D/E)XK nuclease-like domain-containing protein [Rhizobiaceae bacterium n13]|uniref:PD-(D/E)XK nuclease-like domain-containing protein n=1 Tax=Ferirhizobium litorale TaxID=2927786 RepID=UPI0024B2F66F|nr:PD-(D/E)XK nuclease-like domain-containing protein [Fererhizobium litorale]MDI7862567.1 PD-(D/E)XK nuclease-like domain-containing protein [Fererhizobium litorale]